MIESEKNDRVTKRRRRNTGEGRKRKRENGRSTEKEAKVRKGQGHQKIRGSYDVKKIIQKGRGEDF